MTDQELQQLAREYAEAMCPVEDYSCGDYIDFETRDNELQIHRDDAMQVLEWLTKTHCVVSREKVNQLYKVALSNKKSQDILLQDSGIVQTSILEVAFGKSTFEERSEK